MHAYAAEACVYWFGIVPVHLHVGFRGKVLPACTSHQKREKSTVPCTYLVSVEFTTGLGLDQLVVCLND